MEGYYQVNIHLISCNVIANLRAEILLKFTIRFIILFTYFGYTYFGGWFTHALEAMIYGRQLFIALRNYLVVAGVVY